MGGGGQHPALGSSGDRSPLPPPPKVGSDSRPVETVSVLRGPGRCHPRGAVWGAPKTRGTQDVVPRLSPADLRSRLRPLQTSKNAKHVARGGGEMLSRPGASSSPPTPGGRGAPRPWPLPGPPGAAGEPPRGGRQPGRAGSCWPGARPVSSRSPPGSRPVRAAGASGRGEPGPRLLPAGRRGGRGGAPGDPGSWAAASRGRVLEL